MKKLFRLIFSIEIILAIVYAISPLDIYIFGFSTFALFDELFVFLGLTLILAWPVILLLVIGCPVFFYDRRNETSKDPKASTYWWKLVISGILLLISLAIFTWLFFLSSMSV